MNAYGASLPAVIDIELLGQCDLRCPFCYGPRHEKPPTDVPALLTVMQKFPEYGVRGIVITGGEPTLVRELPLILQTAREHTLQTVMSTNGLRFVSMIDTLAPLLDWVALPLDAADPATNHRMRIGNPLQFTVAQRIIPQLRRSYPHVGVKLGTVVCDINRDAITGIPAYLERNQCKPDIWKLYQIAYSVYAADNRTQLELSDEDFERIYQHASREATRYGIPITRYTRTERDGKHLFVTPEGDAMVIARGEELRIGNFYSDFENVVRMWSEYVSIDRLQMNFATTYPNVNRPVSQAERKWFSRS